MQTSLYYSSPTAVTIDSITPPRQRSRSSTLSPTTPFVSFSDPWLLTPPRPGLASGASSLRAVSPITRTPSPAPAALTPEARRALRERTVAAAFVRAAGEPSAREQQIRALRRATAHLGACARESAERAAALRDALRERDAGADGGPGAFRAMQRQRWLDERRLAVLKADEEVVQGLAGKIKAGSITEVGDGERKSARSTEQRKKEGLVRFFELAMKVDKVRVEFRRRRPPRPRGSGPSTAPDATDARIFNTPRDDDAASSSTSTAVTHSSGATSSAPTLAHASPSLDVISLYHVRKITKSAPDSPRLHPPVSFPALHLAPSLPDLGSPFSATGAGSSAGVATIFAAPAARSRAQILAAAELQTVAVPAYAVDLIASFDNPGSGAPLAFSVPRLRPVIPPAPRTQAPTPTRTSARASMPPPPRPPPVPDSASHARTPSASPRKFRGLRKSPSAYTGLVFPSHSHASRTGTSAGTPPSSPPTLGAPLPLPASPAKKVRRGLAALFGEWTPPASSSPLAVLERSAPARPPTGVGQRTSALLGLRRGHGHGQGRAASEAPSVAASALESVLEAPTRATLELEEYVEVRGVLSCDAEGRKIVSPAVMAAADALALGEGAVGDKDAGSAHDADPAGAKAQLAKRLRRFSKVVTFG